MNFQLILLSMVELVLCGRLNFPVEYHKVNVNVLEKGKPIQLNETYQYLEINGIVGTLHSDSLSKLHNVTVLWIFNSEITEIEKGALCSSPSVTSLDLDLGRSRQLLVLTKAVFENCGNINSLILKLQYSWMKLEVDALEDLTSLKELSIMNFNITHLSKNFLKINSNLSSLGFYASIVKKIDVDALENFRYLEQLDIIHCGLTYLPKNFLKTLPKLKVLNLEDNEIKNLTWDEFEGLSSLRELVLRFNQISFYDVDKIAKNLPNLQKFSFTENPLFCHEKQELAAELKKKLPHLVDVTYRLESEYIVDSCEYLD